jgi:predicted DCC family thiol-disulfide oxidoreductase YuxK
MSPPPVAASASSALTGPLLLYDGYCGLCNRAVQWVLAHDRAAAIRFAPLDGRVADQVRARHPALVGVDSLVLVEAVDGKERVLVRSAAVLAILDHIPHWRMIAAIGRLVPQSIRDGAYGIVARSRLRWFGRSDLCPLPTPAQRSRFLLDT